MMANPAIRVSVLSRVDLGDLVRDEEDPDRAQRADEQLAHTRVVVRAERREWVRVAVEPVAVDEREHERECDGKRTGDHAHRYERT